MAELLTEIPVYNLHYSKKNFATNGQYFYTNNYRGK